MSSLKRIVSFCHLPPDFRPGLMNAAATRLEHNSSQGYLFNGIERSGRGPPLQTPLPTGDGSDDSYSAALLLREGVEKS